VVIVSRRDDRRDALIRVNPSAVAAGIIADREVAFGIPHGPANVIAAGVVKVDERIPGAHHDELHPQGINVYLTDRDGVRLTGARTLARDPIWRQLSVRRLVTMLRRTLDQQMQWAVFEPNSPALWSEIRHLLESYLRRLYRANAFRGATEGEAFFVKCDEELNTPASLDSGRLLAYVGVAPAEPVEFIVLQIARDGDGMLRVQG
jgi:phage tail sheath protein FI